jgi:rare lipoprotein A
MRLLIGISLACLVISGSAIGKAPEKSTSHPALHCSQLRTTGISLSGKAAWYNLVGRQTSSGEILDTVTATAAHRSLPLASYAKVTNLDNGRWVVVKINDRGPYTRGRILDLSPRAADALDMKRAGVVAVDVEPLVNQAVPTVAVFPVQRSVDDLGTSALPSAVSDIQSIRRF